MHHFLGYDKVLVLLGWVRTISHEFCAFEIHRQACPLDHRTTHADSVVDCFHYLIVELPGHIDGRHITLVGRHDVEWGLQNLVVVGSINLQRKSQDVKKDRLSERLKLNRSARKQCSVEGGSDRFSVHLYRIEAQSVLSLISLSTKTKWRPWLKMVIAVLCPQNDYLSRSFTGRYRFTLKA